MVNEPAVDESTGKNLNREFTYDHNLIKFDKMLVDPSAHFRNYLNITGTIEYEHRIALLDPIPPAPQEYITLRMSISAEIKDPDSPMDVLWNVSGESEDILYLNNNDEVFVLLKHYFIDGREDGMCLVSRYIVSRDGIRIGSMWLDLNVDKNLDKSSAPIDTVTYPPIPILELD
jgi:hypothetical protein